MPKRRAGWRAGLEAIPGEEVLDEIVDRDHDAEDAWPLGGEGI